MTSILSSISGRFSKTLILGAFFPAVTSIILFMIFAAPLFPPGLPLLQPLGQLGIQGAIIVFLSAIVLSGILYNLNIPILRLYEGYPWRDSLVGKWRTKHYRTKLYGLEARWNGMRTLVRALEQQENGQLDYPHELHSIRSEWNSVGIIYNREFPKGQHLVLPTRLGNVIRSFEDYPYRQYGMESITLWPRLTPKIDKEHSAAIDDARASFDFAMNSSVLSMLLSLSIFITGLSYREPPLDQLSNQLQLWPLVALHWWLLEVVIFAVLAYLFYQLSIGRAEAWGALVKSAFDLYRWDLLRQLGYRQMPRTISEERALWYDIYQRMLYGDSPTIQPADYSASTTMASGAPYMVRLETTRGVRVTDEDTKVKVYLRVKNVDRRERIAQDVFVTDEVPDGFDYEWCSAEFLNEDNTSGGKVSVAGSNPYRFTVGDLKPNVTSVITYCALRRTPPDQDASGGQS